MVKYFERDLRWLYLELCTFGEGNAGYQKIRTTAGEVGYHIYARRMSYYMLWKEGQERPTLRHIQYSDIVMRDGRVIKMHDEVVDGGETDRLITELLGQMKEVGLELPPAVRAEAKPLDLDADYLQSGFGVE